MTMPEPYYADDAVTIYHADCRDVLPHLVADMLFTDPPYGELGYEWDTRPNWATLPIPTVDHAVVFGHQPHLATEVLPSMQARNLRFLFEWIWEKPIGRLWNHARPIRLHELLWCFGVSTEGLDLRAGFGGQHGSVIADVTYQAYMSNHRDATGHPTQKPIRLVTKVMSCFPPGVIVDPFMGSGTTLRAAKDLGRKAIGIEVDERYCKVAADRMCQEVLDFGGAA